MLLVADNFQITNKTIASAVFDHDPEPIRELVGGWVAAGADAIDINSGPLPRDAQRTMAFLVSTIQEMGTGLSILLDTTNPVAMAAGLAASRSRAIVNGISLDSVRLARMLPLVRDFDADVVCYLMQSGNALPVSVTERLSLCVELFGEVTGAGIAPERVVIDPVVAPLMWADGKERNLALIEVIQRLSEVLGFPVRTIAGLSNLTTGFSGSPNVRSEKLYLESAFVSMLAGAGLTMAMVNMTHRETVSTVKAGRALLTPGPFAWGQTGL